MKIVFAVLDVGLVAVADIMYCCDGHVLPLVASCRAPSLQHKVYEITENLQKHFEEKYITRNGAKTEARRRRIADNFFFFCILVGVEPSGYSCL